MWDLVVVAFQLTCVAVLIAGAIVSLWFWRLASMPPPKVEPETEPSPATDAAVKSMPPLKRAA